MAQVVVDTGPIEATEWLDEVPRSRWRSLLSERRSFVRTHVPYDCRQLLRFVEEAEAMFEELGYESAEDLVRRGLEIDPELADWAVRGLRTLSPNEPVTLEKAVALGKRGGQPGNRNAAEHLGNAERKNEPDNNKVRSYGTSREYIAARAERDGHTERADAIREGRESARAVALDLGYRKPVNPVTSALAWVRKMSPTELSDFEERFGAFLEEKGKR